MKTTSRTRVRLLAAAGAVAVAALTVTVTHQASAAETSAAETSAAGAAAAVPAIPAAIKPPANSRPLGAYWVVTGTQNYTCVVPAGATTGGYTGTSTPEAQLLGTGGRVHHFGGPSWQSERDNSLITAAKVAQSAVTGAVPELLLQVNGHTGSGIMTRADYVNRLHTSGGVAPTTACTAGQTVAVPYKAIYVFWDAP
jgi:hypothetical protein